MKTRQVIIIILFSFASCVLRIASCVYAQDEKQGIIVNGDTVEYSTDKKEVIASGNVEVNYKGSRLTCDKLTVNTQTKEGIAEGHPRLDDQRGIIAGEKIQYNFETKTGVIMDADFRSNPYFGRAKKVEKKSDKEFMALGGYITTCNFDHPHFRLKTQKVDFFLKDKVLTKANALYVGKIPVLYIPFYNHSFQDPLVHVQVMPGRRKEWGQYILTGWRYNFTDYARGRIYLDYRQKLGPAQGFGLNYKPPHFGEGDFKFYYTDEKPDDLPQDVPQEYERYLVRWRHRWVIDERTNLITEYYKIADKRRKQDLERNLLKDYFYREYEEDSQPLSYMLLHHSLPYSGLDVYVQKRTNHWYDQLDKMPELRHSMPQLQIFQTPFYFEHNASWGNYNRKASMQPVTADEESVSRLDTTNKFSLPFRLSFLRVTPFAAHRLTVYDKDAQGGGVIPRTIFYTGAEVSTKLYRILNVKSNFLGMDIDGLRHVITPTASFTYNHEPTVLRPQLKQIDSVDAIDLNNSLGVGLSNKLQTKRNGRTVDLATFRVNTNYVFYRTDPETRYTRGGGLTDFLVDLELLPYSWLRLYGDAIYDPEDQHVSQANYDISLALGKGRSVGVGQRYLRKGGNEITGSLQWRLSPKWKFSTYYRYQLGHGSDLVRGLAEQEYTISRDLHCWIWQMTYNIKKDEGHSIWIAFKLKAFPEMEFGFDQSYHSPSSGSQSNP